jgi:glycosyltransferase involved in cell wall biosynthesis
MPAHPSVDVKISASILPEGFNPRIPWQNPITRKPISLLVRGWRRAPHSYALVNQYHLHEWSKMKCIDLCTEELPPLVEAWNKTPIGAGFPPTIANALMAIPNWQGAETDFEFRISSPADLSPNRCRKTATYVVTELGYEPAEAIRIRQQIEPYQDSGGVVITPSRWSRDRIIEAGFSPNHTLLIPHGVDRLIFQPVNREFRFKIRANLGFTEDNVIFLNVGAHFWNKGVDLLVRAYAKVFVRHPHVRLILKDQQNVYGTSSESMILRELSAIGHAGNEKLLNSIQCITTSLTLDQLKELYCLSDFYVSPYRGEGFNLPVIESIACGTMPIVPVGGSTDDFCNSSNAYMIESATMRDEKVGDRFVPAYINPSLDHLVSIMMQCASDGRTRQDERMAASSNITSQFSWQEIAQQIMNIYP